jgi:hypothetical protein
MGIAGDRVRRHTAAAVLRRIDEDIGKSLHEHGREPTTISHRLQKLEREWDIDRTVETEAALTGLVGLALGATIKQGFLAVPLVVGSAVLLYALTGRYPLLPLFRRLGFRTAREVARERYALKALRGDFTGIESAGSVDSRTMAATAPRGHVASGVAGE